MSYTPYVWLPRLGSGLNKYTDQTTGQVLQLVSTPDNVSQDGTPFSATRMNALEQGLGNVYDKSEQMESTIPSMYGLGSGTVPSDIFNLLSSAVLINSGETALTDVLGNPVIDLPVLKVKTGSYTGDGTGGVNNQTRIDLEFKPVFALVVSEGRYEAAGNGNSLIMISPMSSAMSGNSSYNTCYITWGSSYVSWYADNTGAGGAGAPEAQLNSNGDKYYYFVIGA